MKKCPVCHTEVDDGAKFCPECGSQFPADMQPEAKAPEAASNTGTVNFVLQDDTAQDSATDHELVVSPQDNELQTANTDTAVANTQEETQQPAPEAKPAERWYYVEAGKSKGPFGKDQFMDLIVDGTITPATYVWTKGMDEWTCLKNTPLYNGDSTNTQPESQPDYYEEPASYYEEPASSAQTAQQAYDQPAYDEASQADEEQKWFYVVKNRTVGPFSKEVMIRNTQQGILEPNTYVWCEGYDDWKHLSDTPFAQYIPSNGNYDNATFGNASYNNEYGSGYGNNGNYGNSSYNNNGYGGYNTTGVQRRSVLLYLLLSILTCGIFDIIWYYMVAADVNKLCLRKGRQPMADPILVLVFSLLTCGIYSVYFFWKAGTTVYELSDRRLTDNSVVLAILGWVLQPAALAVLQDQINTLVDHNDYIR